MSAKPWDEIDAEIEAAHDYNSTAEAVVSAAVKAFNYAADRCGLTGFQAEWAALRAYGEMLHINGPYKVTRAENLVYPQYDVRKNLEDFIEESMPWVIEQAKARLAETADDDLVHPNVRAHWEHLASKEAV
jgi:hypothetical protein